MYIVFNHEKRKQVFINFIKDWVVGYKSVIDIGCGGGEFSKWFIDNDYETTSIDVINKTHVKSIRPIIYDGINIPFPDNKFDIGLLFTVLHHTKNPEIVVKEAVRVAKRVIIIEDIFSNNFEKVIAMANCSITNRELFNHPHSNKSDLGWKESFNHLGLKLMDTRYFRQLFFGVPLYHGVYLLEK